MNLKSVLTLLAALFVIQSAGYASGPQCPVAEGNPYFLFAENKNQWPSQVRFQVELSGGFLYLENNSLTYDLFDNEGLHERFFHPAPDDNRVLKCHSYKVNFEGSNKTTKISGENLQAEYRNYFRGNDPGKWAGGVPLFTGTWYQDLYNGINLHFLNTEKGQLKYEFTVAAGADPSQIAMEYEGVSGLKIVNGKLIIPTAVKEVSEEEPVAWQTINGSRKYVNVKFNLKGNRVSFELPDGYDNRYSLTIDPTLIFSTFTGSAVDNFGYTATYDESGNLYAGGIAFGFGYPFTPGVYDATFNGGLTDISITKYNPTGTARVYSTYLGGNTMENPHSLIVNANNELYVLGTSNSPDFPALNSFDITFNGGYDIIVTKFNAAGTALLASAMLGGNGEDGINIGASVGSATGTNRNYGDSFRGEINLDSIGNVYVASCSRSNGFPVTVGAPQSAAAGAQDGVAFKMNPTLTSLVWSTYLGGSADDAAFGITVSRNGLVYVTGGTASPNYHTTPGTINPVALGLLNGFVTCINPNGNSILSSTYIGTDSVDQCYFIQTDKGGNVYILGQTSGPYFVSPGVYSNPNSGQFITKMNSNLSSIIYSTVFGSGSGNPNISPTAFLVDLCEFVYVSGWGGATNSGFGGFTNGMPTTINALQPTTDGSDLYFIVFRKDLTGLDYASFMGGAGLNEHVDGGTSRFDKDAVIYQAVCAGCWGSSLFPTTPGVVGPSNGAVAPAGCNLASVKISFPLNRVIADFSFSPATGCQPLAVTFTNLSSGATQYSWNFGNGNTSTAVNPSTSYPNSGTFTIRLIASDPGSCNLSDTIWKTITVLATPVATVNQPLPICRGQSVNLAAFGGSTYAWSPPTSLSGTSGPNVTATPNNTITYTVIVGNNNTCFDTAIVTITVNPLPNANAGNDTTICKNTSATLHGSGGGSYAWTPGGTLNNPSAQNPVSTPTAATQYILTVTNNFGCIDKDTVNVNISQVTAAAGPDLNLCIGDQGTLNGSGGGSYLWSPPTGLSQSNSATPSFTASLSRWYILTVTDVFGCTDLDSVHVQVNALPVVSAFNDTSICLNQFANLSATGASSYQWSPNGNGALITVSPPQSGWYIVTGTDANNCRNKDSVFVTIWPLPLAVAGADISICRDSLVQLFASGGLTYQWSPGSLVSDPFIHNPTTVLQNTGDLEVKVTDANGCQDVDSVHIRVIQPPVVTLPPATQICKGDNIEIIASGAETYLWMDGQTGPSYSLNPDSSVTLSVTGFNEGCPGQPVSTNITVIDIFPLADFLATPDSGWIPLDVQFTNLTSGSTHWDWTFGDGNNSSVFEPRHLYEDSGHFVIRLISINEFGCTDTSYKTIYVQGGFTLFVPNAFSPNGDHLNDYFYVNQIGIKTLNVLIFDRWGMLIFESNDIKFGWDGKLHANDCQEGVYTWVIEGTTYLDFNYKKVGTVTLIR